MLNRLNFSSKRCPFIQIIKIFVCTLLNGDSGDGGGCSIDEEVMIIINVSNANKSNENIFLLRVHVIVQSNTLCEVCLPLHSITLTLFEQETAKHANVLFIFQFSKILRAMPVSHPFIHSSISNAVNLFAYQVRVDSHRVYTIHRAPLLSPLFHYDEIFTRINIKHYMRLAT